MGKPAPGGLTALGFVVLGLLVERPMHPYEMYQTLIDRQEDRMVKVRPGSLYHAVARLADRELIRATGTDRTGNRPERTVYELTRQGRNAQIEWCTEYLGTPIREYPVFNVALSEAHNLPESEVVDLLRRRIVLQEIEAAQLDAICAWLHEHHIPRRYWIGAEYMRAMSAAEVTWLHGLLAELAAGHVPWVSFDDVTGERLPSEDKDHAPVQMRWGWSDDPSIASSQKASEQ